MRTHSIHSSSNTASSPEASEHIPVLLQESIDALNLVPDDVVVDTTLGGAGHAKAICAKLGESGTFVGFDLDHAAIERAQVALSGARPRVILIEANFRTVGNELAARHIIPTKILFDLGWSSYQLHAGRGFSFSSDEPLDMRYGKSNLTAQYIVNTWEERSLADIIYGWGEERYARRIARAIVAARAKHPIETARELGEIVKNAVPAAARHGRIHPATKTFQALRIAVNDELGALEAGLSSAWSVLAPAGRIAVISFHSTEDRLVKKTFALWEKSKEGRRLSKKPIAPSREEIIRNPRARSAKLRIIEKTQII